MNNQYKIIAIIITAIGIFVGYHLYQKKNVHSRDTVVIQNIIDDTKHDIDHDDDRLNTHIKNDDNKTNNNIVKDATITGHYAEKVLPTKKAFESMGTVHASINSQGVSFSSKDLISASVGKKGISENNAITGGGSISKHGATAIIPITTGSAATLSTSGKVSAGVGQPGLTNTASESATL